jgi:hypothetical protein
MLIFLDLLKAEFQLMCEVFLGHFNRLPSPEHLICEMFVSIQFGVLGDGLRRFFMVAERNRRSKGPRSMNRRRPDRSGSATGNGWRVTVAGWLGRARQARSRKNYAVGLEMSCPGGAYHWAPEIPSEQSIKAVLFTTIQNNITSTLLLVHHREDRGICR